MAVGISHRLSAQPVSPPPLPAAHALPARPGPGTPVGPRGLLGVTAGTERLSGLPNVERFVYKTDFDVYGIRMRSISLVGLSFWLG